MVEAKGATRPCIQVERSVRVKEVVLDFLRKYPGIVMVLQKVGARGPSPDLLMQRVRSAGRLRATRDTHDCIQAALLNGRDALRQHEDDKAAPAAVLAFEGERGLVFRSLAACGRSDEQDEHRLEILHLERSYIATDEPATDAY